MDKKEVMTEIANLLNVNKATRTSGNSTKKLKNLTYEEYNITTNSVVNNLIIIKYLSEYPLFTAKYLNYLDWVKIVKIIESKQHKTDQGKSEIQKLKMGMNTRRIYYNWDHLQNFHPAYK
jgi:hypothetical protein